MDWTNFGGPPFHHVQADVDVRREVTRSIVATAAFLAVLILATITVCGLIDHGVANVRIQTIAGSSAPL